MAASGSAAHPQKPPRVDPVVTSGNAFDIREFALHDGHRTWATVFLKGFALRC